MVDRIRLLGRDFLVKRMTGQEITTETDSYQRLNGYIDYNKSIIYVSTDVDNQNQNSTLLHESLHYLFQEVDEKGINEAETKLYAFIRDNPEFIKEMIK